MCKIKPRWIIDVAKPVDNAQVSDKHILFDVQILDANDRLDSLNDHFRVVVDVKTLLEDDECTNENIALESSTTLIGDEEVDNLDD